MKAELKIFVYGTLKRGFANHDRYCRGLLRTEPARMRGRLFKLTPGIPIMTVPAEDILGRGSENIAADLELQRRFATLCGTEHPRGDKRGDRPGWKNISGELLVFGDPEAELPRMDNLEDFRPGKPSTYVRALVRAALADGSRVPAWTYVAGCATADLQEYGGEVWYPDEATSHFENVQTMLRNK